MQDGPRDGERPAGAGLLTVVAQTDDPAGVLARARQVMTAVLDAATGPWPSPAAWTDLLPAWFVARCAPERTVEEEERWLARWRAMGPDARRALEAEPWTLGAWLSWLGPDDRPWSWWSGSSAADRCVVQVEVAGWPVPLGALHELLRAAGAAPVEDDA